MKRAVFIGRWTPFHKGHLAIMQQKIDQGVPLLIFVRNTHYDLYPAPMRKRMIEAAMNDLNVDAKVQIIDDIESVNWGRGVGYEVNEIEVSDNIKNISATKIRDMISQNDQSWKEYIPNGASKVLEKYLTDRGIVVWFTGIPQSGKTALADEVSYLLERHGIKNERLDSHTLRKTISKELGFSRKDRETNVQRATFIAQLLSRNGGVVLASFVSPFKKEREEIRTTLEETGHFVEVFVDCPLEVAKKRDKEGLYEKAEKGIIEDLTGVNSPYESPDSPEITIDATQPIKENAKKVMDYILSLR